MLLKDIRSLQLEELKTADSWPAVFCITVKSFDGRTIKRLETENKDECIRMYNQLKQEYNQRASVTKTANFLF